MSTTPRRHTGSESASPIDLAHLRNQTLGDRDLEAELLALFARQAERIIADLASASGEAPATRRHRADLLHTLCGSARAIGAWDVAAGAEGLERVERGTPSTAAVDAPPPKARADLDSSVATACEAIETLRQRQDAE